MFLCYIGDVAGSVRSLTSRVPDQTFDGGHEDENLDGCPQRQQENSSPGSLQDSPRLLTTRDHQIEDETSISSRVLDAIQARGQVCPVHAADERVVREPEARNE